MGGNVNQGLHAVLNVTRGSARKILCLLGASRTPFSPDSWILSWYMLANIKSPGMLHSYRVLYLSDTFIVLSMTFRHYRSGYEHGRRLVPCVVSSKGVTVSCILCSVCHPTFLVRMIRWSSFILKCDLWMPLEFLFPVFVSRASIGFAFMWALGTYFPLKTEIPGGMLNPSHQLFPEYKYWKSAKYIAWLSVKFLWIVVTLLVL